MRKRELRGRSLIVTGASSGIGAATAVEAGRAGMAVTLAAPEPRELARVATRVRDAGGEPLPVTVDVAEGDDVEAMVAATMDRFGRLDGLFANAGFGHMHELEADIGAYERRLWEVNYYGALRCVRSVVPRMRQHGGGHVLLGASLVGLTGLPYYSTYAATKGALIGLFASLRDELAPDGIEVSCVFPGSTRTAFHEGVAERSGRDPASEATPGFMTQAPESVARAVIRCLRRPQPEVWPHPMLRFMSGLWRWFPRFREISFRGLARQGRSAAADLRRARASRTEPDRPRNGLRLAEGSRVSRADPTEI